MHTHTHTHTHTLKISLFPHTHTHTHTHVHAHTHSHTIASGRWNTSLLALNPSKQNSTSRDITIHDALLEWYLVKNTSRTSPYQFRANCQGPYCYDRCPDSIDLSSLMSNNWHPGAKVAIAVVIIGIAAICLLMKMLFVIWLFWLERKQDAYLDSLEVDLENDEGVLQVCHLHVHVHACLHIHIHTHSHVRTHLPYTHTCTHTQAHTTHTYARTNTHHTHRHTPHTHTHHTHHTTHTHTTTPHTHTHTHTHTTHTQFPYCVDEDAISVSCLDVNYSVSFRAKKAVKDEKKDQTAPVVLNDIAESSDEEDLLDGGLPLEI